MNPLLRKWKAAALRLAKQWKAGLKRLIARPRSLERLLLFTIAGIVLFSIVAIALTSLGLLREPGPGAGALARARRGAPDALRDPPGRRGHGDGGAPAGLPPDARAPRAGIEHAAAAARSCAASARPRGSTAARSSTTPSWSRPRATQIPWQQAFEAAAEQGEGFMIASRERGPAGALVPIPGLPGGRILTIRMLDDRLAKELSRQVGVEIHLLPVTAWLESVEPGLPRHALGGARDRRHRGRADPGAQPVRREPAALRLDGRSHPPHRGAAPRRAGRGRGLELRAPARIRHAPAHRSLRSSFRSCSRAASARRCRRSPPPRSGSARAISPPRSRPRARRKSRRSRARWKTCGATSWT